MKTFVLQRDKDISGVSGTGIVAEGVQFKNGKCVMCWLGEVSSIVIYDNIELVQKIHGHDGATKVVWGEYY
jgi:hypothetical protein